MATRILILSLCFLAASAYIAKASHSEPTLPRESLVRFPTAIGGWQGRDLGIEDKILDVLGVDDYLNRLYVDRANTNLTLYVGFYKSQRQGSTMHSPLNCLPGAGWNPAERSHLSIPVSFANGAAQQPIDVNRIIIEKGADRQLVLYWYQAHGRVVASEYWGKIYTVVDAMRLNRTDGALVRVIVPVAGTNPAAAQSAEASAVQFVQSVFPMLSRYLPD